MKVFINDRSIVGQAADLDDAMGILSSLAALVVRSNNVSFRKCAYRTRALADRAILGDLSVRQVLIESVSRARAIDERQRKLAIGVFLRQPFAESIHTRPADSIIDDSGDCLKETCFDNAASSIGSPLAISAGGCNSYKDPELVINSSIYGRKTVLNVSDERALGKLLWVFEHNPKHRLQEYQAAGEEVSVMDLSPDDAQLALSMGIKVNSRVYSNFGGGWYQFHCHEGNLYHGFKVKLKQNNPDHEVAFRLWRQVGVDFHGQVFA